MATDNILLDDPAKYQNKHVYGRLTTAIQSNLENKIHHVGWLNVAISQSTNKY